MMAPLDAASADAPGPWDVETADDAKAETIHHGEGLILIPAGRIAELLTKLAEVTALAEERLAGLGRLRAECEAWQTASAGWQARCGELEGLLGEALHGGENL